MAYGNEEYYRHVGADQRFLGRNYMTSYYVDGLKVDFVDESTVSIPELGLTIRLETLQLIASMGLELVKLQRLYDGKRHV